MQQVYAVIVWVSHRKFSSCARNMRNVKNQEFWKYSLAALSWFTYHFITEVKCLTWNIIIKKNQNQTP